MILYQFKISQSTMLAARNTEFPQQIYNTSYVFSVCLEKLGDPMLEKQKTSMHLIFCNNVIPFSLLSCCVCRKEL